MDPEAGFSKAPIFCELPATEKLGELLHMRPSFTTPALSPALEIILKDTARQLL